MSATNDVSKSQKGAGQNKGQGYAEEVKKSVEAQGKQTQWEEKKG